MKAKKGLRKLTAVTLCTRIHRDFAERLRNDAQASGRSGGVSRLVEDIVMAHYSRADARKGAA